MHNKLLTLFLYHKIFPNISFSISSRNKMFSYPVRLVSLSQNDVM